MAQITAMAGEGLRTIGIAYSSISVRPCPLTVWVFCPVLYPVSISHDLRTPGISRGTFFVDGGRKFGERTTAVRAVTVSGAFRARFGLCVAMFFLACFLHIILSECCGRTWRRSRHWMRPPRPRWPSPSSASSASATPLARCAASKGRPQRCAGASAGVPLALCDRWLCAGPHDVNSGALGVSGKQIGCGVWFAMDWICIVYCLYSF
jgi:hypothetical protein